MPAADHPLNRPGPGIDITDEPTDRGDALLTLPNLVTIVRLVCLPVFVWLLFGREHRAAAAWMLGGLGATDWIDGWIARRWNQISELGKILDPVADRLLFFVGIGAILIDGSVPVWFAAAVLVREAVVATTTVVIAAFGARRVDVTWWGKAGTFFLMFAFPFFLASHSTLGWSETARWLAWFTGIPGLVLSYIAWVLYAPIAVRALREGRSARAAGRV